MSNLASNASRIAVPGRSLWWLAGAIAAGVAIPVAVGTMAALLGYYPVGSFLPPLSLFSFIGTVVMTCAIALMVVAVGIWHSVVAWNWRPLALAVIAAGVMVPGVYVGIVVHLYLRMTAFDALADRSSALVEAIKRYERDTSGPPATLADLLPRYLAEVPHTGMAAHPDYEYATASEFCSAANAWSVFVIAAESFNYDVFMYCPEQDYPAQFEAIGDWAYLRE